MARGRYAYGHYLWVFVNPYGEMIVTLTAYALSQLRLGKNPNLLAGLEYDKPVYERLSTWPSLEYERRPILDYSTVIVF
jgi:hypothetical protein